MNSETTNKRLQSKAYGIVQRAIINGYLPKLDGSIKCFDCDKPAENYDHRDYRYPLFVQPVCTTCNLCRGKAKTSSPTRNEFHRVSQEKFMNTCKKCNYAWRSIRKKPKYCPYCKNCKSPRWNEERRR